MPSFCMYLVLVIITARNMSCQHVPHIPVEPLWVGHNIHLFMRQHGIACSMYACT